MLRRTLVKLRDVRLSTLVGDGSDGIAYVQLAGFSQGAGTELASTYYNCFCNCFYSTRSFYCASVEMV
jgi:hypothetical protein